MEPQFCVLVERRESCESLTVRSNGKSTDDSQRWVTLRNWDFVKSFSGMLCALTHPLTHSRSKIKMKHKGITEKQLRWRVNGNKRGGKTFPEQAWKISIPVLSTDCLFPMCVISQWLFYLKFALIDEALWGCVHVITGPCKWKLCALIFPVAGKPSLASLCSLCASIFHCGMLSSFAGPKNHSNFELFA